MPAASSSGRFVCTPLAQTMDSVSSIGGPDSEISVAMPLFQRMRLVEELPSVMLVRALHERVHHRKVGRVQSHFSCVFPFLGHGILRPISNPLSHPPSFPQDGASLFRETWDLYEREHSGMVVCLRLMWGLEVFFFLHMTGFHLRISSLPLFSCDTVNCVYSGRAATMSVICSLSLSVCVYLGVVQMARRIM